MNELTPPIQIRGAREHNLKNLSVNIPSQQLVVITGPSGSGKSSLAFDTLFAEGQRRYLESLSAYARQFLEQLSRPEVDFIDGLSPAISIEQKTISSHPRSTVGTVTGIYDFLRLLYSRVGDVRDPETGAALKANTVEDVISFVETFKKDSKIQLFASIVRGRKGEFLREFDAWRRAGFSKVRVDSKMLYLDEPILLSKHQNHDVDLLLDIVQCGKPDLKERITAAWSLADKHSEGWLRAICLDDKTERLFSQKLASPRSIGAFPDLEPRLFSFNSPYGMCTTCRGVGLVEKAASAKKIAKKVLSDDDDEAPIDELENFVLCTVCNGARLRPEALWVFYRDRTLPDLCRLSCSDLLEFFQKSPAKGMVDKRILEEVTARLQFLSDVGVSYLALDRRTSTISGGEAQRLRLATQLGSELSGVLYVLDEPSIGLHPADHTKLLASLKRLRDLGNSVIVVEHDEETMLSADYLIDIGPAAGAHGGKIVSTGTPKELLTKSDSETAKYLRNELLVSPKRELRKGNGHFISIEGCSGHNLKNIDLKIPLGALISFTGVSGSGKSSLVSDTLVAAISKKLYRSSAEPLDYSKIDGLDHIDKLVHVDQSPIGRSPRSNPATYTGLFAALRTLYSQIATAQIRGYTPGTFSFNVKGGRCDRCEGAGRIKIEMHFMPNVFVPCETCNGSRYRREVLEVLFKGKSISDALRMTAEEALEIFSNQPLIEPKLRTLVEVGLGYITLGQSAVTLSGGEAQRIKLAKELSKRSTGKTLYFLDEPTTGLHFGDIKKLLELCQRLCDLGNTVLIIEHNLDVICASDWVIDMGPKAGTLGGRIVQVGTPSDLAKKPQASDTSRFVAEYFKRRAW